MAYLRTLEIGNPARADADAVYATGTGDYKVLQDYIFRFIATECGRLGMSVHIHVAAGGGSYFHVAWANPLLLEPLLNDPTLRKTTFVMIHGGWPFTREITPLLTKPNAYVDFSEQTAFNTPHDTAEVLRGWLSYVPEQVLFATDAYPFVARARLGGIRPDRGERRARGARPRADRDDARQARSPASRRWRSQSWCCATTRGSCTASSRGRCLSCLVPRQADADKPSRSLQS